VGRTWESGSGISGRCSLGGERGREGDESAGVEGMVGGRRGILDVDNIGGDGGGKGTKVEWGND